MVHVRDASADQAAGSQGALPDLRNGADPGHGGLRGRWPTTALDVRRRQGPGRGAHDAGGAAHRRQGSPPRREGRLRRDAHAHDHRLGLRAPGSALHRLHGRRRPEGCAVGVHVQPRASRGPAGASRGRCRLRGDEDVRGRQEERRDAAGNGQGARGSAAALGSRGRPDRGDSQARHRVRPHDDPQPHLGDRDPEGGCRGRLRQGRREDLRHRGPLTHLGLPRRIRVGSRLDQIRPRGRVRGGGLPRRGLFRAHLVHRSLPR